MDVNIVTTDSYDSLRSADMCRCPDFENANFGKVSGRMLTFDVRPQHPHDTLQTERNTTDRKQQRTSVSGSYHNS